MGGLSPYPPSAVGASREAMAIRGARRNRVKTELALQYGFIVRRKERATVSAENVEGGLRL